MPQKTLVYVGTYTGPIKFGTGQILEGKGKGIYLLELLSNLYSEAAQYRHLTMVYPGRMKEVYEEHKRFLDALYNRDANEAEKSVREHYESTLQWLVDFLKIIDREKEEK
jgi:DNA-binding GntR family transcriptional regulator